jgi:hypothetical protein
VAAATSYRATAGLEKTPPWLHTASVLDRFDEWDGANAAARYREVVGSTIGTSESPWEQLRAGLYLGGEAFMQRIKELTQECKWKREHLKLQQNVRAVDIGRVRAEVERYFATAVAGRTWRNETAHLVFALLARTEAIALLPDIGTHLDITASEGEPDDQTSHSAEQDITRFRRCDSQTSTPNNSRKNQGPTLNRPSCVRLDNRVRLADHARPRPH